MYEELLIWTRRFLSVHLRFFFSSPPSHTCQGVLMLDLIAVQDSVFAWSELFFMCPDVLSKNVTSVTVFALCAS